MTRVALSDAKPYEPGFAGDSPYYDRYADRELKTISKAFEDNWYPSRVLIIRNKGDLECRVENTFWHWISYIFTWWIPFLFCFYSKEFVEENQQTFEYFFDAFGKDRIERISDRYGLDLMERYRRGDSVTKGDLEAIYLGIADIRFEDLETLLEEINGPKQFVAHLNQEFTDQLRGEFTGKKTVYDLSKRQIDVLWGMLSPFSKMETIFFQRPWKSFVRNEKGGTFNHHRNRIFYIEEMRRTPIFNSEDVKQRTTLKAPDIQDEIQDRWSIRMMKRIVDDYLPTGVVVPHPKGYHYHYHMINKQGAFKLLFKGINKDPEIRNTVCALSTRATGLKSFFNMEHWRSRCEILCSDVGVFGTIATYDETKEYYTNPDKGFVDEYGQLIDLMGYSLGGKHMENDLVLFLPIIHSLVGICHPGSHAETADWFAERIGSEECDYLDDRKLYIKHLRENDDAVFDLQDTHLGVDCDPRRVHVRHSIYEELKKGEPFPSKGSLPSLPTTSTGAVSAVWDMLFHSILDKHGRETTRLDRYAKYNLTNQGLAEELDHLNYYLRNSEHNRSDWEIWRKILVTFWESPNFVKFCKEHPLQVSQIRLPSTPARAAS